MRFKLYITMEHVSGPELDEETVLDALCATIGQQNGARPPVMVTSARYDEATGETIESAYVIKLADDRP